MKTLTPTYFPTLTPRVPDASEVQPCPGDLLQFPDSSEVQPCPDDLLPGDQRQPKLYRADFNCAIPICAVSWTTSCGLLPLDINDLIWLAIEYGLGIDVLVLCFVDKKATETNIKEKLGNGFSRAPFCRCCADYVETRFNQSSRNDDINIDSIFALDVFNYSGYALGKAIAKFDIEILKMIEDTNLPADDPVSNDLRLIARGPDAIDIRYEKFISNGFRFHTKEVEHSDDVLCNTNRKKRGMTPKRRTKRKSRFKLQTEIDMQPSAMCTNHTNQHSIEQGMTPKHRTKRKSRFKLQIENDMQPSAMCTNHTDRHSIEQGTLNNQRDAVSNQFYVDVQDHIPYVENNSLVPNQNDDMNEKSNEDSDDVLHNKNRKKRGPTFMKEIWGRPSTLPRIEITCDDMGRPIGTKRNKSTDFLGSLARNDYVETKFNQSSRNDDINIDSTFALDVFNYSGYALGKAIATKFDIEILKKIEDTNLPADDPVSNDLRLIARDQDAIGIRYEKFISNGFRFHINEVERMTPKRRTKRKSRFKLQTEIDMQPSAMCTNHTNQHSIEQGLVSGGMTSQGVEPAATVVSKATECKIGIFVSREVAYDHLTVDGFIKGYIHWVAHGEIAYSASTNSDFVQSRKDADDMQGLIYEAFGIPEHNDSIISTSAFENDKEIPTREAEKFYKLIDDSQKELYPDYVETKFNQSSRNDDINIDSTFALDVFNYSGYALGKAIATKFDIEILKKVAAIPYNVNKTWEAATPVMQAPPVNQQSYINNPLKPTPLPNENYANQQKVIYSQAPNFQHSNSNSNHASEIF
ncbi:hypothetical protein ZIOFF_031402 [Zingiber officinale]|uniref:Uncharacterized protein n=1 Tax=Zingiber officinale TaxID=94328 RepID=A0A8J5GEQ0_ZINOF|nr:hypothetical protein ZIOFF_031402 [Zingiber officinale]